MRRAAVLLHDPVVVERYEGEEIKEAMQEVMAQQPYRKRKEIVERIFAELAGDKGSRAFVDAGASAVRWTQSARLRVRPLLIKGFRRSGGGCWGAR